MYVKVFRWEVYAEKVPPRKMFIDWDISPGENHVWIWAYHILFNDYIGGTDGQQTDNATNRGS